MPISSQTVLPVSNHDFTALYRRLITTLNVSISVFGLADLGNGVMPMAWALVES